MLDTINNTKVKAKLGLTPKQIVEELNRFIIGQLDAKKAVAIALRNRYRRKFVGEDLREEIMPKNILMVGPTGVGKTEIARRLAKLANAPFIKVEATKFTEVGYVGRDVESIIRDLVEIAINMNKAQARDKVSVIAKDYALERVIDALVGASSNEETRKRFKDKILNGDLDQTEISIKVIDNPNSNTSFDIPGMPGSSMGVLNLGDILGKSLGGDKLKTKKLKVVDALKIITTEESDKLIDQEKIIHESLNAVQDEGIIFIDEIDKITSRENAKGAEVNREGVQRDLLPLIEGTVVNTKHGPVKTDHMLFISSGAFHLAKPSDLLPELQGRLPIRVELKDLTKNDLIDILKEPEASLVKQYIALLSTEEIEIEFTDDAIEQIAEIALKVNDEVENIGARRLHTLMEKLFEELSYEADSVGPTKLSIDKDYVNDKIGKVTKEIDLAKFIL